MWALPADKKILLDIFGKESSHHIQRLCRLQRRSTLLQPSDEMLLLWSMDPTPSGSRLPAGEYLPDVIVVRSEEIRNFIAWATTVISGYRPFTAFFKVLGSKQAELALESKEPSLGELENSFAGLIIGEALTLSANQRALSALSLLPCQSTYSYCFARAFALGYVQSGSGADPVAAPMALARRLTRQPARKLDDELLAYALRLVAELATDVPPIKQLNLPTFIWESCREIQVHGEVKRSWQLLEDGVGFPSHILREMKGPREQRVRTFERVLKEPNRLDSLTASFLVGLLTDQIAPGTFEHVDLLLPYLSQYPMALIWYGLCAGLHPDSEVQQVGNCLGRRLIRDLLAPEPLVSRPKYDISVRELEVYLDREAAIEFRVASQNHMAVELLPGVPAYMKWPVKDLLLSEPGPAQPRETLFPAPGQQGELALKPISKQFRLEESSSSTERQSAVRELEKAVERVKLILELGGRGTEANPKNDGGGRSRRKGH